MSRQRAKRILGMTIRQWAVLGVLFLLMICILVGGFWWLNSMVTAAYTSPALPTAANLNVTPSSTPTPVSTATLTSTPTATPILYESLIPSSWKQFKPSAAPGMEIWLPPTYVEQTEKELKATTVVYDAAGARPIMALMDTAPSPYLIITTFEASSRAAFAGDLDKMIDSQFGELLGAGRSQERDDFVFLIGDYVARRLIVDVNLNGVDAGVAIYAVQVGGDVYFLGFATAFNELYTRLPDFDQAIQTFRIVPVVPTLVPSPTLAPPTNTPKP
jgi:hypothetical protein